MKRHTIKYKVALIALGVFTLTLFLTTTLFFSRTAKTLDTLASEAVRSAEQKDAEGVRSSLEHLRRAFDERKWKLKLLLDHEEIDKLEITLTKAERALSLNENSDLLYSLDEFRDIAEYIGQIELPLLTNIF